MSTEYSAAFDALVTEPPSATSWRRFVGALLHWPPGPTRERCVAEAELSLRSWPDELRSLTWPRGGSSSSYTARVAGPSVAGSLEVPAIQRRDRTDAKVEQAPCATLGAMKPPRSLSLMLCAAILLGCRMSLTSSSPAPVAAAPSQPQPQPEVPPASEVVEAAPTQPKEDYRLLWTVTPEGWADATVITPSGDVASVSRGQFTVYARHDGSVLESGGQCSPIGPRAMTVMRGKIYLACSEEIRELTLPGMRYKIVQRGVLDGKGNFQEAAFGGDKVVYAHNDGTIEVYSTTSWQRIAQHQLPKSTFSPAIAVSADGAMFTYSDGDTETVELFDGSGQHHNFPHLEEVVAFNMAGTHVFGSSGSFLSAEAALADGEMLDVAEVGSWLTAAIYFADDHKLAIAESNGLHVKHLDSGALQTLSSMTAETLAVSADGNLICGADRGDQLSCFGRGTIEPSAYRAVGP